MSTKKILLGISAGLAATAAVIAAGIVRFRRQVAAEVDALISSVPTEEPQLFSLDRIVDLPEPIQRYFRCVLPEGQPLIRSVRLKQRGQFRGDVNQNWMPITAEQYFVVTQPGFVWHARATPLPLFWIEVRDRYARGAGNMLIKLFSTLTVADVKGPEMDEGSLSRLLAEMPVFPTALLGDNIQWQAIDDNRARAIMRDQGMTIEAVFYVNSRGEITHCVVKNRPRTVAGSFIQEQWTGYFRNYQTIYQMKIPTEMEAVWNLAEGDFSYGRLTITEIEYDVPFKN